MINKINRKCTNKTNKSTKNMIKVKLLPKCNQDFFCECIWVKPSTKEAFLRFDVFLFSGVFSASGTVTKASKSATLLVALTLKMSLTWKNEITVNRKSASFAITMLYTKVWLGYVHKKSLGCILAEFHFKNTTDGLDLLTMKWAAAPNFCLSGHICLPTVVS